MPLEHILRAMQAQAEMEIEKITRGADEQVSELVAEAETEAKSIYARHHDRVEPLLLNEAASLQNKAKLGALRAIANAREQLLVQSFTRAQECLADLRASKQYPAVFRALAREATAGLGRELVVRVDPKDAALARATFADLGVKAEIQEQSIPLGGLEVATPDRRVIVTNTLAARLERSRNLLRGPVAAILTDQSKSEKEWTTTTGTPTRA